MVGQTVIRIILRAYDHRLIDSSCANIVDQARKMGFQVSGPVPLPTKKEIITILRSVHKHKDSREQFEQRTHKRLIDVINPTPKFIETASKITVPAGVDMTVKMKKA